MHQTLSFAAYQLVDYGMTEDCILSHYNLPGANKFGPYIEIVPKKASVSLRTKKQFVLIRPTTKTRIDLGIKLKDKEPEGRLESSGPFGTMCTHRIQLTDVSEVDDEVIKYMREAYEKSK